MENKMNTLVNAIVSGLVDHPEEISLQVKEDEHNLYYHLSVNPEDAGRVIGKHGKIAKAIRTVVYAASNEQSKRIHLDIQ
jgi:predicted RNA-binding protein YlqC (UPF0109 family)